MNSYTSFTLPLPLATNTDSILIQPTAAKMATLARSGLLRGPIYKGAGTTFRLVEQKLVKNNQNNKIQNITPYSMYFSKKKYILCTMEPGGKPPEAAEFSRILC